MTVDFLYKCDECEKVEGRRDDIINKKVRIFSIAISDYFDNEVKQKFDICSGCLLKLKLKINRNESDS